VYDLAEEHHGKTSLQCGKVCRETARIFDIIENFD